MPAVLVAATPNVFAQEVAPSPTPLPPVSVEASKVKAKAKSKSTKPAATAAAVPPSTPAAEADRAPPEVLTPQPFERQQSIAPAQVAGSNDSARLFQSLPGISLQTGGGVSSLPYVNGLGNDRIKILVNGMSLTSSCSNHMNPPLSYIDATAVDKVSVVAGVTPVSMGGDSIGGTISVNSKPPVFADGGDGFVSGGRASTFYRSNGDGFGASVAAFAATEHASLSYSGSTVRADNYKDGGGREIDSTLYKATNHLMSAAGRVGDDVFGVDVGWQSIPYQGFVNQWMDMTDNESVSVNAFYRGKFDWGFLDARIYRQAIRHSMNMLEDKASLGWDMPMETRGSDTGYEVKAGIDITAQSQLRVGHDYHRYRLDDWWPPSELYPMMGPNDYLSINDGRRDRLGLFAELETQWTPAWSTLVGARFDRVSTDAGPVRGYNEMYEMDAAAFNARDRERDDNNIDLTATARYEPGATSAFEFGAARKTRSPNLYERYAWSNEAGMAGTMINWFGDLNAYTGNPDLDPEVAHSARASAEWHDAAHRDWHLKLTGHLTHVTDYINAETNPDAYMGPLDGRAALRFVNHDAQLYGADVEATKALGYLWGTWRLSSIFSYVAGRDLDSDNDLYNIMPANARFSLSHALGGWTSSIELQAVAAKERVDEVRLEQQTGGYALVNLRTSYQLANVRFDAGIDNLFDTDYELPLGGLSAYVYRYDADNLDRAKVHGPGRSLNVGLTVEF